jgi:hypothetical protein
MTDYVIINGTGSELTDVNAGGDDVAAYTISGNVTLDATELSTVASLNGVAVMQASASAAEKAQVGNLLIDGSGAAPGTDYEIINASGAVATNVNAGGDDLSADPRGAGSSGAANGPFGSGISLTPSEAWALLGTAGVYVGKSGSSDAEKNKLRRAASRILKYRKAAAL